MRSSLSRGPVGRVFVKSLLAVATAGLLAGCSNSIERFSAAYDNPSDADPVYTASVPQQRKIIKPKYNAPTYQAPSYDASADNDTIVESPVARASIPQVQKPYDYSQAYKPAYKQPKLVYNKPKLVAPQEQAYDDTQDQSYDAPVASKPIVRKPAMSARSASLKVGSGMTMYSIARANGLSVRQLAAANHMSEPYTLMVGQTLRIPGASSAQMPQSASNDIYDAPAKKPAKFNRTASLEEDAPAPKLNKGATHTVDSGETLYSLGRKYGVSPFVIADANNLNHDQSLSLGQKLRIPGASTSQTASAEEDTSPVISTPKKKAPLSLAEDEQVATDDGEPAIGEVPQQQAKATAIDEQPDQMAAAPVSPAGMSLRWPLKGKVISGFGSKPNGLKNEGINIAVPEGTSVRAAEGGVVAYAGNELKGYGNLVLIRHTGGYVTAYAHAKELFVKRGDTVKRGDIIAKAGQTGAVSSPQLHFEVRKGATALDPLKFISSTTASN